MNEYGLMFGECANGSFASDDPEPGKCLFHVSEPACGALERCAAAREAVLLMGDLIGTCGYCGIGETLPVAEVNAEVNEV